MTEHLVRRASLAEAFPYGYPGLICYFELRDGALSQLRDRASLREATVRAHRVESTLFAAWPGAYRTDVFHIDNPALLAPHINVSLD